MTYANGCQPSSAGSWKSSEAAWTCCSLDRRCFTESYPFAEDLPFSPCAHPNNLLGRTQSRRGHWCRRPIGRVSGDNLAPPQCGTGRTIMPIRISPLSPGRLTWAAQSRLEYGTRRASWCGWCWVTRLQLRGAVSLSPLFRNRADVGLVSPGGPPPDDAKEALRAKARRKAVGISCHWPSPGPCWAPAAASPAKPAILAMPLI